MKRVLLTILLTALISASIAARPANGKADEILARMQKAAKSIATLRAGIEQKKKIVAIGAVETYKGTLIFRHAGQSDWVRINYTNGQQVSVDPSEIVLFQPRIPQVIITPRGNLASQNQEFAFFSTPYSLTSAQMKERYEIVYLQDENIGVATSVLLLKPRGQSAIKQMKWWVSQVSWLPVRSETIDAKSGDVTTFTLSNLEVNPKISAGDFKIKWPAGTQVIRK